MGFLSNIKATAVQRTADKDVVAMRRNKFASQVNQQLAMLSANAANTPYTATKLVQVVDSETGQTVQKEVAKRVKQWYFEQNGKLYMQFYYGNKVLVISKKGSAVECANKQDLERLLKDALVAIDNAEFDECIAAVSKATRAAFKK